MGTQMHTLTPMTTAGHDGSPRIASLGAVLTVGEDAQQSAGTSTSPGPFPAPNTPPKRAELFPAETRGREHGGKEQSESCQAPAALPAQTHGRARGLAWLPGQAASPRGDTSISPARRLLARLPSKWLARQGSVFPDYLIFGACPEHADLGLSAFLIQPLRLGSRAGGAFLLKIITEKKKEKKKATRNVAQMCQLVLRKRFPTALISLYSYIAVQLRELEMITHCLCTQAWPLYCGQSHARSLWISLNPAPAPLSSLQKGTKGKVPEALLRAGGSMLAAGPRRRVPSFWLHPPPGELRIAKPSLPLCSLSQSLQVKNSKF